MKEKKITYNPRGLKRTDNAVPNTTIPKQDLNLNNISIQTNRNNYWVISKKK